MRRSQSCVLQHVPSLRHAPERRKKSSTIGFSMTSISALRLKANGMAPAYCSCCGPIGSIGEHRPLMCTLASTSARTPSLPLLLDAVVASANRCLILDVRYKPYWIMSDLAALSGLGFALAFSSHLRQVSAFGLRAGILGALLAHKVVLEIKAAVGAVAARSFLQRLPANHYSNIHRDQHRMGPTP
jgi:hypothetical protein